MISRSYKEKFQRFGEIRQIDLSDPTFANAEIDAYISQLSRDHISSAIHNNLTTNSISLFTNVMYFSVEWEKPFETITDEKFTDTAGKEYKVQMMSSELEYSVHINPNMELIEVPLKQEFSNFGFFLVRPRLNSLTDTIEVEKELKTIDFQFFLDNSESLRSSLALPAFTMFYSEDLTDDLRSLGVKDIFDDKLANMTGFFEDHETNAYEDAFNHQGWIHINQHGFTVAAFAGDGIG